VDRHDARALEILSAIDEGRPLSQRALAARMGIALGLVNLYLRRLSRKGFVKIAEFPAKPAARKRLQYLLTPKGLSEKSRLAYQHMIYSLNLFRRTRETLRASLARLVAEGTKRVALYGPGEAAELAYLTLKEFGLEPVGIFAPSAGGEFLGFSVQAAGDLRAEDIDAVIVATFERPEADVAALVRGGLPPAKCLTLRRLAPAANGERP
jgi:DNA-binding MarR family transcriptional regulator